MSPRSDLRGPNRWTMVLILLIAYVIAVIILGETVIPVAAAIIAAGLPVAIVGIFFLLNHQRNAAVNSEDFKQVQGVTLFRSEVPGLLEDVKDRIKKNVESQRRFRLENEAPLRLDVRIGVGIATWGENVVVRLSKGENGTNVEAECEHRLATTVIDFGQSQRDLKKLLEGIISISTK